MASSRRTVCRGVGVPVLVPLAGALQAKRAGPGFAKLLAAVAQSVEGATHKVGPLKKLYRMVEKTALRAENCRGLSADGGLSGSSSDAAAWANTQFCISGGSSPLRR